MESDGHNTHLSISTGTLLRAVLVLLLVWFLFVIRDLVLVVLAAVVIASAIEPATALLNRYRVRRLPAVLLVYLVSIGILAGLFYFLVPPLLTDASDFLASVPAYLERLPAWNPLEGSTLFKQSR
ncbi:MAG: hypothetical protein G01um101472_174 [Parcubacteria group bacterium Gr01-1014_72]|nr:MAG: hypothetical protein G01um101472_174 [Parcubacteria group bacterium Gr01-1014_72]